MMFADRLGPGAFFTWLAELSVYYRILREQGMSFPFSSVAPFVLLAKWLGIVLVVGLPLAFVLFWLGKPLLSFATVTAVGGGIAILIFEVVSITEPHHSAKAVAVALKTVARQDEPIIHQGSLEYSGGLPFYTGRQIHVWNGRRGDLEFGSRDPEGANLFLNDAQLARLWQGSRRGFLVTRRPGEEVVLAGLSGQRIFLLGRYGSRSLYSNYGS